MRYKREVSNMHPQNDIKTLLFDFALILLGIFGTIGCFATTFALPFDRTTLLCMLSITILYFFFINSWHKHFRLLSIASFGLFIIVFVLNFQTCKYGFVYMMNCILETYQANSQYSFQLFSTQGTRVVLMSASTFTIYMLFVPIIMIVVYSIRQRNVYFLSFMVTIPFLFSILLFTLVPPWTFFIMMLLFYVAMLGMHVASRFDAHSAQDSIRKLGFVFTLCAFLVIMGIQLLIPTSTYVRDAKVDAFRLDVQMGIRDLLYGAPTQENGVVDLTTAKNRFYIGNVELRVKSDEQSTLYLHGYSGTLYKDNTWYTPELSYYEEKIDFLTPSHPFDISKLYYEQLSEAQKANVKTQNIEITYEDALRNYVYTPYYAIDSISDNRAYDVFVDSYIAPLDDTQNTYAYRVLSQEELLPERLLPYAQQYMDAVMFTNLTVPTNVEVALRDVAIPGLREAKTDSGKIALIQKFMKNFGTYTLTPGETPTQEDFIAHFLKTKQGYCVHYASAATMLLRLHGIPARYAEGYRVDPADFKDDTALAKDYNAHAWVEIFDQRFGWVPLEVTPSTAYGTGTTNTTLQNQDPEIQSQNQASNPDQNTSSEPTQNKDVETSGSTISRIVPIGFILLFVCACLSLPIRHMLVRKGKEQKFHQSNRKEAVLEVAKDIAYFVKDNALPKDIKEILEEARFSKHAIKEDQYVLIMQYLKIIRKQKFATYTWKQKLLAIWWYNV